jgi:predicted GIY-YIG superfamily endonuclease
VVIEMADRICCIYKLENLIDGKVYVGQTTNFKRRRNDHISLMRKGHRNRWIKDAVDKYGYENFDVFILEECPEELLDEKEIYWVNKLKSYDRNYGYNNSMGGKNHVVVSEQTKKLMSKALRGEKSRTATIKESTANLIVQLLMAGGSIHGIAKQLGISHKIVESIRSKRKWKHLTVNVVFPEKRSSKYKWVSKVPDTNNLYRALVRVDGKKLYDKCWDNEYDAAVAREIFIRENHIENTYHNFPDDMELTMPVKEKRGESQYYGVTRSSSCKHRWVSSIHVGGKQYYVGSFGSDREAAIAREEYLKKYLPNAKVIHNQF